MVLHEQAELTTVFALKHFSGSEEKDAACIKDQPGGLCAGTLDPSTLHRWCNIDVGACTIDSLLRSFTHRFLSSIRHYILRLRKALPRVLVTARSTLSMQGQL